MTSTLIPLTPDMPARECADLCFLLDAIEPISSAVVSLVAR